ncbi:amidase [Parasphingorhabdus sp.]|uniref:amidase n=1 Tax=Parasphingorhabdus sp. TaxID=2709688 RepID=UPI00329A4F52
MKNPELNAWCDYEYAEVEHAKDGPLRGLTLAVKDIFQVKGYRNGWGQPSRLAEAQIDTQTQPEVQKLLEAGIDCTGKSQCEELCFSLIGINAHYGAPVNVKAPDRVTGGSSSGSASLVAAGAVDVATASDTGGSVRAPAAFCGLIGLRITHGRLSLERSMPLAPSFDCFGWFARDIETYAKVADVLLGQDDSDARFTKAIRVSALEELLSGDDEKEAYFAAVSEIEEAFEGMEVVKALPFSLPDACETFVTSQAFDAWGALGDWITSRQPELGAGVKERFEFGASVSQSDFQSAEKTRQAITTHLETMVANHGVLVMPTVPSCAPKRNASQDALQDFRHNMLQLLCLSGLTGLPQITLPLAQVHGAPFGISILGPRGADQQLIGLAKKIMKGRNNKAPVDG